MKYMSTVEQGVISTLAVFESRSVHACLTRKKKLFCTFQHRHWLGELNLLTLVLPLRIGKYAVLILHLFYSNVQRTAPLPPQKKYTLVIVSAMRNCILDSLLLFRRACILN
jgi:hypothetical protein